MPTSCRYSVTYRQADFDDLLPGRQTGVALPRPSGSITPRRLPRPLVIEPLLQFVSTWATQRPPALAFVYFEDEPGPSEQLAGSHAIFTTMVFFLIPILLMLYGIANSLWGASSGADGFGEAAFL
jgi:hypothetical protein